MIKVLGICILLMWINPCITWGCGMNCVDEDDFDECKSDRESCNTKKAKCEIELSPLSPFLGSTWTTKNSGKSHSTTTPDGFITVISCRSGAIQISTAIYGSKNCKPEQIPLPSTCIDATYLFVERGANGKKNFAIRVSGSQFDRDPDPHVLKHLTVKLGCI